MDVTRPPPVLTRLRPLWWLLAALPLALMLDAATEAAYRRFSGNSWAQQGQESLHIVRTDRRLDFLVVGDSSARHAVDIDVLDAALGVHAWNLGTYRAAWPSQVALLMERLKRDPPLKGILVVTTDHGMALPIGDQEQAVAANYYTSLQNTWLWWRQGDISGLEALQWLFGLLVRTVGAGKPVETLTIDVARALRHGGLAPLLQTRAHEMRSRQADDARWRGHHRGEGSNHKRVASGIAGWRTQRLSERSGPLRIHPSVERWLELLLTAADQKDVPVYFVFTPRAEALVADARFPTHVASPAALWADALGRRHPSWHYVAHSAFPMRADEYFDTSDHLNAAGSERFTRALVTHLHP